MPYGRDIIEQWIAADSELETCAPATEDEIIREVTEKFQSDQPEDEDDDDDDNESFEVTPATCSEAKAAMEVMNRFVLGTDTHENQLNLHFQYKAMIQTMIQSKTNQKLRQGTLDCYLKGDEKTSGL